MPGPVLDVGLSPNTGVSIGSTAQQAKSARAEVARLEKQLIEAAKLENVPAQLSNTIKAARGRSDELARTLRADQDMLSKFRGARQLGGAGLGAIRGIGGAISSGNYAQLLYGAEGMLSSPRAARIAGKLGLAGAQDQLMKAMPAVAMLHQLHETANQIGATNKSRTSFENRLREMYAKGEIDESKYRAVSNAGRIGGQWFNDTHFNVRDYFANLPGSPLAKTEEIQQKLLSAGNSLGDDVHARYLMKAGSETPSDYTRFKKWASTKLAAASPTVFGWMYLAWKDTVVNDPKNGVLIGQLIAKQNKAIFNEESIYGKLDEAHKTRVIQKVQEAFKKENPGFAEMISDLDNRATQLKTCDDEKHPFKPKTLSQQYHEAEARNASRALFREYRHGYVPFNRSGK